MYRPYNFLFLTGIFFVFTACLSKPADLPVQEYRGEPEEEAGPTEKSIGDEEFFPEIPAYPAELPVSSFDEIWAYLISGEEQTFKPGYPLSDIGYFGAEVNVYGEFVGVPNRRIPGFSGRVHLVVCCNSTSLTHFVLEPGSAVRKQLIADLLKAVKPFDGLQIDFENVPARDGDSFRSFLAELRAGLDDSKMFTVALRARTRSLSNDVYDYRLIAPLVDRILIMAYDEHWSTSPPGPVASMAWCRAVAAYGLLTIPPEKLIMGMPFYGRTWGSEDTFRAFFHSGIERIKRENQVTEVRRESDIPTFTYEIPLTVTVYYDDEYSLSRRIEMYRDMGVKAIGFWRLGQETPAVWNLLNLVPQN
ncbi:MAG: glycoside hydrolase [Spirochaetaceae bacterium]|jgi:spore germination protein YaaH|nr:glycoside hydrolase [Spirochaetaceae bacterium]